jgi:stage IV sporulation protein FB
LSRIKFHPLFFLLALLMVATGRAWFFFAALASLFVHEGAHALTARRRGYIKTETVLLPFGAALSSLDRLDKKSEFFVALAGPLASLFLFLVSASLFLIVVKINPAAAEYILPFYAVNLGLFLINLLPAFPLDGARIVLALSKDRIRALKALKIPALLLSAALFIAFVVSAFFKINWTLALMSVFLLAGATYYSDKEYYACIYQKAGEKVDKIEKIRKARIIERLSKKSQ